MKNGHTLGTWELNWRHMKNLVVLRGLLLILTISALGGCMMQASDKLGTKQSNEIDCGDDICGDPGDGGGGGCDGAGGVADACGICNGDGSSCGGCDGAGGVADACGVCDGDGSSCATSGSCQSNCTSTYLSRVNECLDDPDLQSRNSCLADAQTGYDNCRRGCP